MLYNVIKCNIIVRILKPYITSYILLSFIMHGLFCHQSKQWGTLDTQNALPDVRVQGSFLFTSLYRKILCKVLSGSDDNLPNF